MPPLSTEERGSQFGSCGVLSITGASPSPTPGALHCPGSANSPCDQEDGKGEETPAPAHSLPLGAVLAARQRFSRTEASSLPAPQSHPSLPHLPARNQSETAGLGCLLVNHPQSLPRAISSRCGHVAKRGSEKWQVPPLWPVGCPRPAHGVC